MIVARFGMPRPQPATRDEQTRPRLAAASLGPPRSVEGRVTRSACARRWRRALAPPQPAATPPLLRWLDDEHVEDLRVVAREHVEDEQVRLVRPGIDNRPR